MLLVIILISTVTKATSLLKVCCSAVTLVGVLLSAEPTDYLCHIQVFLCFGSLIPSAIQTKLFPHFWPGVSRITTGLQLDHFILISMQLFSVKFTCNLSCWVQKHVLINMQIYAPNSNKSISHQMFAPFSVLLYSICQLIHRGYR